MSNGLTGRMKALATRAKRMAARLEKIPRAEFFKSRFAEKGETISQSEAKLISKAVREHRKGLSIKPKSKKAVSSTVIKKRQKRTVNHGY